MKILITAFEPFGGETVNAAQKAVRTLNLPGVELIKLDAVPVTFAQAGAMVTGAMAAHRPDAVLCVGQAEGRGTVTVERVAINVMDARIPDNAGFQPVDQAICPQGPAAYFSTLPIKDIVAAMQGAGVPAQVSNSAGTYVCNCLLYEALHAARAMEPQPRVGFIHLPLLPGQAQSRARPTPSLPLEDLARALETAVKALSAA